MGKSTINIRSYKLFPFHFQVLGILFLILTAILVLESPYFAPLFFLSGAAILTGYRGVQFDLSKKSYREYNSFLFIKFGKWENFDAVEKIYVNSANVSQYAYTMVTTGTTIRSVEYNAYAKLGNDQKVHLICSKNKKKLTQKLSEMASLFQLEVIDNTARV